MKAMVLKNFGGVENFELKDIPEPMINEKSFQCLSLCVAMPG